MAKTKTTYEKKARIVADVCHLIDEGKRCNLEVYARGVCPKHYQRLRGTRLEKKFMNKPTK